VDDVSHGAPMRVTSREALIPRSSRRFDFDPTAVCPDCFTVRATTGACNCA
jgi:hypothetical protein